MEEGYATNKPPLFKGVKYQERMIAHFKSIPIDLWNIVENGNYIPYDRFMLNSKALNALLCSLSKEEYTKVHSFKSEKQMWDTLAITYEGSSKWRPQVTTLRALKTLDTMSHEEPVGTLKGKSLALSAQKAKKAPSSEESSSRPLSKSVSKALSMENSSEEEFDEDDELAFISTKIRKMCKNKSGSRLKKSSKKNLGHFKSECLELEKSKDKYKHFKSKDKKSLMSTWEDLNDTTSDEEGEE
ncbi:hypothetical protein HKD37_18G050806 [Glycine soja]